MLSPLWAPVRLGHKRRRGGWRQQIECSSSDEGGGEGSISLLAAKQLRRWADGKVSAADVHEVCADAVSDGMQHVMVKRLADLRGGKHSHEDIMQLFQTKTGAMDAKLSCGVTRWPLRGLSNNMWIAPWPLEI